MKKKNLRLILKKEMVKNQLIIHHPKKKNLNQHPKGQPPKTMIMVKYTPKVPKKKQTVMEVVVLLPPVKLMNWPRKSMILKLKMREILNRNLGKRKIWMLLKKKIQLKLLI